MTNAREQHMVTTQQQLLNLQFYSPRTPRHQLLLPALIQRWCQLHFSYWLELRWNSLNDVVPPQLVRVVDAYHTQDQLGVPPSQTLSRASSAHDRTYQALVCPAFQRP
jgi:hypothetical protein